MAASAPIQFTVDQEQLKVVDTNIARSGSKKRGSLPGYTPNSNSAVTRPSSAHTPLVSSPLSNGSESPESTPAPASIKKQAAVPIPNGSVVSKADIEEWESPKTLATDPGSVPDKEEQLPEAATKGLKKKQEEDVEGTSSTREGDIYADKVLACKNFPTCSVTFGAKLTDCGLTGIIENKEDCVMCSG